MKENFIKISVITPVFNGQKLLKQYFQTIFNQSLKNVEFIIIDDGSTDKTSTIIKDYQQKDNRIILLTQKNQGPGSARNLGIKNAQGEFITFLDCDDSWEDENVLKDLYETAKKQNVLICGGKYRLNSTKKGEVNFQFDEYFFKNNLVKYSDYQEPGKFWKYIYNREFLIKENLYFPPYLRAEDPIWFVKTMLKAKEFFAMDRFVYVYTYDNPLAYAKKIKWSKKMAFDYLDGLKDVLTIAKKNNLNKLYATKYERVINIEFRPYFNNILNLQGLKEKVEETLSFVDKDLIKKEISGVAFFHDFKEFKRFIKHKNNFFYNLLLIFKVKFL